MLTSPRGRNYIGDIEGRILNSREEMLRDIDEARIPGQPYWGPLVGASRSAMAQFLRELAQGQVGRVEASHEMRIRLLLRHRGVRNSPAGAGRTAVQRHVPASAPRFVGTFGACARLLMSDEAMRFNEHRWELEREADAGFTDEKVRFATAPPGQASIAESSVDLTDGFNQFHCERLACYLSLGFGAGLEDAREITGHFPQIWDDDLEGRVTPAAGEVLSACFVGMPMSPCCMGEDMITGLSV